MVQHNSAICSTKAAHYHIQCIRYTGGTIPQYCAIIVP
jgi:hypothetical protein